MDFAPGRLILSIVNPVLSNGKHLLISMKIGLITGVHLCALLLL